jgi:hypothetical protein
MSSGPSDNLREIHSREIQSLYYQIANNSIAIDQTWHGIMTEHERQQFDRERPDLQVGEMSIISAYCYLRQCSINTAIIEIARDLGLTSQVNYRRLLQDISEPPTQVIHQFERPLWDREVGELRWGNQLIRTVARFNRANQIVMVFDAFERQNWQHRINDPIVPSDPERLNQTIRTINRNLLVIRFSSDGTGAGIRWGLFKIQG